MPHAVDVGNKVTRFYQARKHHGLEARIEPVLYGADEAVVAGEVVKAWRQCDSIEFSSFTRVGEGVANSAIVGPRISKDRRPLPPRKSNWRVFHSRREEHEQPGRNFLVFVGAVPVRSGRP